jgi:hypothetical protein
MATPPSNLQIQIYRPTQNNISLTFGITVLKYFTELQVGRFAEETEEFACQCPFKAYHEAYLFISFKACYGAYIFIS